jgi:hypothetical protein
VTRRLDRDRVGALRSSIVRGTKHLAKDSPRLKPTLARLPSLERDDGPAAHKPDRVRR